MAPEVMPVTCYNLDPLINLIYFYHLDSLVVVLLQPFMKFCYFKDLLTISRVCRKGDDYYFIQTKSNLGRSLGNLWTSRSLPL